MAGGVFGFVLGAATAVLILKVFRRNTVKQIKAEDLTPHDPNSKVKGAMRAINDISSILGELSSAKETESNGKHTA